jgi:hypothetical protein
MGLAFFTIVCTWAQHYLHVFDFFNLFVYVFGILYKCLYGFDIVYMLCILYKCLYTGLAFFTNVCIWFDIVSVFVYGFDVVHKCYMGLAMFASVCI